jgi:hypothetical protein
MGLGVTKFNFEQSLHHKDSTENMYAEFFIVLQIQTLLLLSL